MTIPRIEAITADLLKELKIYKAKDIKVEKIAKHLGVEVEGKELESNISGIFLSKENKAFIFYNKNENSSGRRNFTIAHELGHFVLHKGTSLTISKPEIMLFRNEDSSSGEQRLEIEANAFAASLLMPESIIRSEIQNTPKNTPDPIDYLATQFRVSKEAIGYRLVNLGYEINGMGIY